LLDGGVELMWVHGGHGIIPPKIQIADQDHFVIQLYRHAHVWDELASSIYSDGKHAELFRIDRQGPPTY
jgi:hypothetical protein